MTVRKRFDRELFEKYDQLARQATTQYLKGQSYAVEEHPDRYAQDLVVTHGDTQFYAECEVKIVWEGGDFPYPDVQLPQRKQKFFSDPPTLFFIWDKPVTSAMTFWSTDIVESGLEPVEVPNKYVYSGEYFYQVPLNLTKKVSI